MSQPSQQANISIVQQVYAAFAKRDIPEVLALLDPNVEWGEPNNPLNPSAGTRHGHAGFLEWATIGQRSEDILVLEPREFLSNDRSVAVIGFSKCRVKPTGKVYDSDFVHLVTLKEGKVIKFQEFFDTYAAWEAFRS